MNKIVSPRDVTDASASSSDIPIVIEALGKPDGEQHITQAVETAFQLENPACAGHPVTVATLQRRLDELEADRGRHAQGMVTADLLEAKFFGPRPMSLPRYELAEFCVCVGLTVGGMATSMHALACYMSDADVVYFLNGNYVGSLLMSLLPATGALAFRSRGSMAGSDKAEADFYKTMFKYGIVAFGAWVAAVSIVYAPHKPNMVEIQQSLANGTVSESWLSDLVKSVGENLVLGTQLCAETLLAPFAAYTADTIHRKGRPVSAPLSTVQIAHKAAIENINARIDDVSRDLSDVQGHLAVLMAMKRARINTALALFRNLTADRHAAHKQADAGLLARYKKGGSR